MVVPHHPAYASDGPIHGFGNCGVTSGLHTGFQGVVGDFTLISSTAKLIGYIMLDTTFVPIAFRPPSALKRGFGHPIRL